MSPETVLVEHLDNHGRVQWRERFALRADCRTLTIGRSIDADVTLDDPHAAAMHASIEITPEGRILASDLGSLNGLIISGRRCRDIHGLVLADNLLQVGHTRLRVRTAQEILKPEKPDKLRPPSAVRNPFWIAAIGAVACGAQSVYASWLGAPLDLAAGIVGTLALSLALVAGWVAFWALLSRVMQGEWRWTRHAAIILCVAAILVAIAAMIDLGWFMFALPPWGNRNMWIAAVALGCALYLHLTHASELTAGRAALIASILPLLLAGGSQWLQVRNQARNVNYIGGPVRIYPPELRLRASDSVEDFFKSGEALREAADKTLANAPEIESDDGDK